MSAIEAEDKLADAMSQARAQYDSIKEMVEALQLAEQDEDDTRGCRADEARQRIHEDALSVEVRSGWYSPMGDGNPSKPEEYQILLCTGGPAVRIVGELNDYCEPVKAVLECQDWFTPWTPVRGILPDPNWEEVLLTYARCFYFGEG